MEHFADFVWGYGGKELVFAPINNWITMEGEIKGIRADEDEQGKHLCIVCEDGEYQLRGGCPERFYLTKKVVLAKRGVRK